MYSVKNLIKVMSYFATAVIFITAVSLFAMQGDDGRAYAADAVASISVTPIQSVLDVSDRRTVYSYDDSTGKYSQISYYDVYDYDKIKLTLYRKRNHRTDRYARSSACYFGRAE